ncbi:MAG: alpha/beta hydrolase [Actinobacteria bacterium]|nr:alpha/beta hydrolase [Actinomycetota bacterium]
MQVGKHRIFLREAGAGPLVLLLHGWPETSYSWRHQLPALADAGYRAVAIDGLGYGRSSRPPHIHDYRVTELVAVAAGVVRELGAKTATVIGHDWGSLVAWTAAWTRPEVFTSVVGMSPPFGGRGLMAMAGSPFGEVRPSVLERELAGPDKLFYTEYFDLVGRAEAEFDSDVRGWLRDLLYTASASVHPPGTPAPDVSALDEAAILEVIRASPICIPPGGRLRDGCVTPEVLPDWLSQEELDHYVAEFERTGLWGGFNWYRCMDLNWEILAPYEDLPVTVPALYVGADFDFPWIVARQAIERMEEKVLDLRGQVLLEGCGHWMQQEAPAELNRALVGFLDEVWAGARAGAATGS